MSMILAILLTIFTIFITLMLYACVVIAKESDEKMYDESDDETYLKHLEW